MMNLGRNAVNQPNKLRVGQSKPIPVGKPVPVDLTENERQLYELEGAMVYYRELIEQKLRRGEEVPEDDELVVKMWEACHAFERYIAPNLTVEQLAELDQ